MLKIDRNVSNDVWDGDAGSAEQIELPRLRGGMVHLEDAQVGEGVAVGEGVQASAEQDVLRYSVFDAKGERVFCVSRARDEEGAEHLGTGTLGGAKLLRMWPKDSFSERVVKDERRVDGLMGSATECDAQSSAGWTRFLHDDSIAFGTRRSQARMGVRKLVSEMRRVATRMFRVMTDTQTLAQDDDRRALMKRLARVPDECMVLHGSATPAELLDHLEQRLMQPYLVLRERESVKRRKLRVARLLGRFCERGAGASERRLRDGYRQISDDLRAFGL